MIASELGSGHYDDATRTWDWGWDKAQWRAIPRLRLDLHVTYADGSEQVVASDELVEGHGLRPDPLRQLLPGRDLRRAARGPGMGPARLRRLVLGRGPGRERRPRASCARRPTSPSAVVSTRPPGARTRARAGRLRLRRRPEPHRLGGDPRRRSRRHRGRGLLLGEARRATAGPARVGNDLVFGQLQTDYYVAKGAGDERWAPRFSYKGFQYVQLSGPAGAPLPAGRVGLGRAHPAGAHGPRRHRDLRVQQRDAQPDPPQHRVGGPEQPARHRHRHARLREERAGRATRSSPRAPPRSSSTPSGSTGRCSRTCSTRRPSRAKCRCWRRATRTTATSASRPSSRSTAAARPRPGTRSGS